MEARDEQQLKIFIEGLSSPSDENRERILSLLFEKIRQNLFPFERMIQSQPKLFKKFCREIFNCFNRDKVFYSYEILCLIHDLTSSFPSIAEYFNQIGGVLFFKKLAVLLETDDSGKKLLMKKKMQDIINELLKVREGPELQILGVSSLKKKSSPKLNESFIPTSLNSSNNNIIHPDFQNAANLNITSHPSEQTQTSKLKQEIFFQGNKRRGGISMKIIEKEGNELRWNEIVAKLTNPVVKIVIDQLLDFRSLMWTNMDPIISNSHFWEERKDNNSWFFIFRELCSLVTKRMPQDDGFSFTEDAQETIMDILCIRKLAFENLKLILLTEIQRRKSCTSKIPLNDKEIHFLITSFSSLMKELKNVNNIGVCIPLLTLIASLFAYSDTKLTIEQLEVFSDMFHEVLFFFSGQFFFNWKNFAIIWFSRELISNCKVFKGISLPEKIDRFIKQVGEFEERLILQTCVDFNHKIAELTAKRDTEGFFQIIDDMISFFSIFSDSFYVQQVVKQTEKWISQFEFWLDEFTSNQNSQKYEFALEKLLSFLILLLQTCSSCLPLEEIQFLDNFVFQNIILKQITQKRFLEPQSEMFLIKNLSEIEFIINQLSLEIFYLVAKIDQNFNPNENSKENQQKILNSKKVQIKFSRLAFNFSKQFCCPQSMKLIIKICFLWFRSEDLLTKDDFSAIFSMKKYLNVMKPVFSELCDEFEHLYSLMTKLSHIFQTEIEEIETKSKIEAKEQQRNLNINDFDENTLKSDQLLSLIIFGEPENSDKTPQMILRTKEKHLTELVFKTNNFKKIKDKLTENDILEIEELNQYREKLLAFVPELTFERDSSNSWDALSRNEKRIQISFLEKAAIILLNLYGSSPFSNNDKVKIEEELTNFNLVYPAAIQFVDTLLEFSKIPKKTENSSEDVSEFEVPFKSVTTFLTFVLFLLENSNEKVFFSFEEHKTKLVHFWESLLSCILRQLISPNQIDLNLLILCSRIISIVIQKFENFEKTQNFSKNGLEIRKLLDFLVPDEFVSLFFESEMLQTQNPFSEVQNLDENEEKEAEVSLKNEDYLSNFKNSTKYNNFGFLFFLKISRIFYQKFLIDNHEILASDSNLNQNPMIFTLFELFGNILCQLLIFSESAKECFLHGKSISILSKHLKETHSLLTLEAFGENPSKERKQILEKFLEMNLKLTSCFIFDSLEAKDYVSSSGIQYLQEILLILCFVSQNSGLFSTKEKPKEIESKIIEFFLNLIGKSEIAKVKLAQLIFESKQNIFFKLFPAFTSNSQKPSKDKNFTFFSSQQQEKLFFYMVKIITSICLNENAQEIVLRSTTFLSAGVSTKLAQKNEFRSVLLDILEKVYKLGELQTLLVLLRLVSCISFSEIGQNALLNSENGEIVRFLILLAGNKIQLKKEDANLFEYVSIKIQEHSLLTIKNLVVSIQSKKFFLKILNENETNNNKKDKNSSNINLFDLLFNHLKDNNSNLKMKALAASSIWGLAFNSIQCFGKLKQHLLAHKNKPERQVVFQTFWNLIHELKEDNSLLYRDKKGLNLYSQERKYLEEAIASIENIVNNLQNSN